MWIRFCDPDETHVKASLVLCSSLHLHEVDVYCKQQLCELERGVNSLQKYHSRLLGLSGNRRMPALLRTLRSGVEVGSGGLVFGIQPAMHPMCVFKRAAGWAMGVLPNPRCFGFPEFSI